MSYGSRFVRISSVRLGVRSVAREVGINLTNENMHYSVSTLIYVRRQHDTHSVVFIFVLRSFHK